jgi:hypothetical protein
MTAGKIVRFTGFDNVEPLNNYNWAIGMAGMVAIILIGWLYPVRDTDRNQL